jgi:sugar phosphate isomerase/epimerase
MMFSYQLYSSRNFPPLSATLQMVARDGYDGVEGYGALYADAGLVTELAEALKATGLTMPTGHFSLQMIEDTPDRVIEIARALGITHVYCPHIVADQRPTDGAGWTAFGARLQKAGAPIKAAGLGFGWHNHDFEFVPTADGVIPMTAILAGGPDLEWEMDVAWVVRGGADPLAWIAANAGRITAAHVKDIAPKGENLNEDGWADVGHGTVDWPAIMAALRGVGVTQFVMEHDNPSDHARLSARSIAAAKAL